MDVLTSETCWALNNEIINKWHQVCLSLFNYQDDAGQINIIFLIISRSVLLRMKNISLKICTENQNTQFFPQQLFRTSNNLWNNVGKYYKAKKSTENNMPHAHCVLDFEGYRHILWVCTTYCSSTEKNGCANGAQYYVSPFVQEIFNILSTANTTSHFTSAYILVKGFVSSLYFERDITSVRKVQTSWGNHPTFQSIGILVLPPWKERPGREVTTHHCLAARLRTFLSLSRYHLVFGD